MAEPKTRPTGASVEEFLAAIADRGRREDAVALDALMRAASGDQPVMWGTSIVGYGELAHANARGKETTWPVVAFSPRKTELVLYLNTEIEPELFDTLGPHRRGVSCLYFTRLSDADPEALRRLLDRSIELARS